MRKLNLLLPFLLALPLLSGCISMAKEYPKKTFFILEAKRELSEKEPKVNAILKISAFRVAEKFGRRGLVYRLGENRYESDYYNLFLVSPSSLLEGETLEWISNASIFDHVVASTSMIDEDYLLEGNVISLYADYRNKENPVAVIEIRLMVFKKEGNRYKRFFQSEYRGTADINAGQAVAVVKGYNRALKKILTEFEAELHAKFEE